MELPVSMVQLSNVTGKEWNRMPTKGKVQA